MVRPSSVDRLDRLQQMSSVHDTDDVDTNPMDRLRSRSASFMDAVAVVRWRAGGIVAILVVAALVVYVTRDRSVVPSPAAVNAARSSSATTVVVESTTTTASPIVVDVGGAVRAPGVYSLPSGSRVADAVAAAGGLTDDADTDRMNLAERTTDGRRVYIVRKGQTIPVPLTGTAAGSSTGIAPSGAPGPIDVNTASAAELDALPGVGPATAQAIVDHRTQNGKFAAVDDLAAVKGIGPAKLAQLRTLVVVS